MAATQYISYPFGSADVQAPAYAATLAVTIVNQVTFLSTAAAMSGAMTVNLTITAGIKAGARLMCTFLSDGTARTVTWGTGFSQANALAGVISKTKAIEFIYNGTAFVPTGSGVQID